MLPTTAQLNTYPSTNLGNLKPFELQQVIEALKRHRWKQGTPVNGFAGQSTLSTIVSTWTQV